MINNGDTLLFVSHLRGNSYKVFVSNIDVTDYIRKLIPIKYNYRSNTISTSTFRNMKPIQLSEIVERIQLYSGIDNLKFVEA